MGSTPLLDLFKRGEVDRDVRLQAAQGAFAPRAHEQLAILVLLQTDSDLEVRTTARQTLDKIPVEALRAFLGRSDVSVSMREFFADRGVSPDQISTLTVDEPLVTPSAEAFAGADADADRAGRFIE